MSPFFSRLVWLLLGLGVLVACRSESAGFAGTWRDPLGTCYIHSLVLSPSAVVNGTWNLELITRDGRVRVTARQSGEELEFDQSPGVTGHLALNAGKELRYWRVFAEGAPDEDIDWKFYR